MLQSVTQCAMGTWKRNSFSNWGVRGREGTPFQKPDTEAKDKMELPSLKKKKVWGDIFA